MILHIADILSPAQIGEVTAHLGRADWRDGRVTAGPQSAQVKHNSQVAEDCPHGRAAQRVVLAALERHPCFLSAALPLRVFPPLFNRYAPGDSFGDHIDNAIRAVPGTPHRIRTDLSATLFLAEPGAYDGGALEFADGDARHQVRLDAGSMVLYNATTVHRVAPVTRGVRLACFFWVQSLVKDAGQRALLHDMDSAIQELTGAGAAGPALVRLTGCYHNLVRQWSEL